jgi:hypothetical protein
MKTSRVKSKAANSPAATSIHDQASSPSASPIEQVAIAAYFKAESRGFEPGHELEDWLAAEREVH